MSTRTEHLKGKSIGNCSAKACKTRVEIINFYAMGEGEGMGPHAVDEQRKHA